MSRVIIFPINRKNSFYLEMQNFGETKNFPENMVFFLCNSQNENNNAVNEIQKKTVGKRPRESRVLERKTLIFTNFHQSLK